MNEEDLKIVLNELTFTCSLYNDPYFLSDTSIRFKLERLWKPFNVFQYKYPRYISKDVNLKISLFTHSVSAFDILFSTIKDVFTHELY